MMQLWAMLARLRTDRRGVTVVEYGLIGVFILAVVVVAVTSVGQTALQQWRAGVGAFR